VSMEGMFRRHGQCHAYQCHAYRHRYPSKRRIRTFLRTLEGTLKRGIGASTSPMSVQSSDRSDENQHDATETIESTLDDEATFILMKKSL
jgi:hypothetical protein